LRPLEKARASEDRKIPNTLPTGSGCDLRHQISRCSPPEPSADIKTTFLDQNICPSLRVFFFGLLALVSSLVLNSRDQSWISFHSHNTRSRQPATRETSHGFIMQSPVHLWKNESGKFCLNLLRHIRTWGSRPRSAYSPSSSSSRERRKSSSSSGVNVASRFSSSRCYSFSRH
jgi:hypothetical protein